MTKNEGDPRKRGIILKRKRRATTEGEMVETPARRDPVSIEAVVGGIPPRPEVDKAVETYIGLARKPLQGFLIPGSEDHGKGETFVVVGPPLNGEEANAVMYFPAPVRRYGLDPLDIIYDWKSLYDGSVGQNIRRRDHARMPGWGAYEASREIVHGVIERHTQAVGNSTDPTDVIIPVMLWTSNEEGQKMIPPDPVDDELRSRVRDFAPEVNTSKLDTGMGAVFLAAYSPGQTHWSERAAHGDPNKGTNAMTATQSLAFTLRMLAEQQADPDSFPKDRDIQRSPILAGYEIYIKTGILPNESELREMALNSRTYP